jgi:hypothetical protein
MFTCSILAYSYILCYYYFNKKRLTETFIKIFPAPAQIFTLSTVAHVKVKVTLRLTVSQSVSLGVKPHLGPMTRYVLLYDSYGLVLVGRPLDERTGLSFLYAAGPCQRSLSRVRVPWDLRPYFTVSDSRLPFSSPPTTRRATVEVFDPASTRLSNLSLSLIL